jgi:hypothetical protein
MSLGNCDGSSLGNSLGSRVGRLNDGSGDRLVLVREAGLLSGESSLPEAMKTTTRATATAAAITASRANSGLRRFLGPLGPGSPTRAIGWVDGIPP